nr:RagB/SusD family nutrient uptake outer membrane protein [Nonlabens ulvanivorans]
MHFELFRAFTPEYDNPSSPSAIVVDQVIIFDQNNVTYLGRNTAGEMLTQINADFALAESLIDPTADNKYRITLAAIDAFQARVGLYENTTASLTAAVANATAAINAVPISGQAEYDSLFRTDDLTGEAIFSIEKDTNDGAIGTLFTDTNNDIFFEVSDDLVFGTGGILASSNADVRFPLLLDFETDITDPAVSGNDFPVGKYVGRSRANQALHDHKILRTSEMFLIRAEANAKLDGNDTDGDAAADIALIRAARGSAIGTPAYADLNEALLDIARERRLELAYEGHRVYDLKRTNTDIVRDPADCAALSTPCNLAISSGRFTLPIPQTEIDANNAIQESDQNPGY